MMDRYNLAGVPVDVLGYLVDEKHTCSVCGRDYKLTVQKIVTAERVEPDVEVPCDTQGVVDFEFGNFSGDESDGE